jgi:hypothetical protein
MAGRGYTVFDTAIGRCGIAWSDIGIVGVQLPEVREIETRRRLFRLYPEARELPRRRTSKLQSKASSHCCAGVRATLPTSRST